MIHLKIKIRIWRIYFCIVLDQYCAWYPTIHRYCWHEQIDFDWFIFRLGCEVEKKFKAKLFEFKIIK